MANRVVLGAFDGTYVLRVSTPTKNVLDTALSKQDIVFDSRWYNTLNLHQKGSCSIPSGVNNDYITLASWPALNNNPIVLCYFHHISTGYRYVTLAGGSSVSYPIRIIPTVNALMARYTGTYTINTDISLRYICFKEAM